MGFQGGFLNVFGLMATQNMVSHITGIVTRLAIGLSSIHLVIPVFCILLFFLLGSLVSGQLVDLKLQLKEEPRYEISFGLMLFLISMLCILGISNTLAPFTKIMEGTFSFYFILVTLSFVLGMQNALITTVSKSVIRTTHLTGLFTDLGIGIVRSLHADKLKDLAHREKRANLMRLGIAGSFSLGAGVSYRLTTELGYFALILPILITGSLFITMCIRKRMAYLFRKV